MRVAQPLNANDSQLTERTAPHVMAALDANTHSSSSSCAAADTTDGTVTFNSSSVATLHAQLPTTNRIQRPRRRQSIDAGTSARVSEQHMGDLPGRSGTYLGAAGGTSVPLGEGRRNRWGRAHHHAHDAHWRDEFSAILIAHVAHIANAAAIAPAPGGLLSPPLPPDVAKNDDRTLVPCVLDESEKGASPSDPLLLPPPSSPPPSPCRAP